MQIKEFKYQTKQTKTSLLACHGVFLARRSEGAFAVFLFQVEGFYVEMFYDETEAEIGYIRSFSSVEELTPYLNAIDLCEIFEKRN